MLPHYYLGVMSGTSLDGVDLALMDFSAQSAQVIATDFVPMPPNLRENLTALLHSGQSTLHHIGELDHQLGVLYAESINQFLAKYSLRAEQIQAVGCHGQTIWHAPQGQSPFTWQLGDANIIVARTGITTVADFRRKDMAYGGQGAPLVPAFHHNVFADPTRNTVVLNIGGISNISVLIPNQPVLGYDTGVGNALLDSWIAKHQGKSYDKNGEWAASGQSHPALLQALLADPYFSLPAPKSTGREQFNLTWLEKILQKHTALPPQDVQATLAEFTAQCTAQELRHLSQHNDLPCLLLVCGGGAKNPVIMAHLSRLLPEWQIATTTDYGLDADYLEAAAFAWLAYRRIHNLPSNQPSVTGATKAVSLGVIYPKDD
ncbi:MULTISPECIES: anhydro-N-acetylmuramic acid kinase [unclassified Avibacterium]|uniref:anhydro-N-acetylmuramic acid kinase n=1 Tax=unclassified Avibacterium TaxID=2685287 RepID=UPI0020268E05|nr:MULTISPECIES: anhydro-N-acetylmuramic acid kinase [unclassified Avibacterium]MCW9699249.1 anhydro-N-acetylmuramic acid kinase [Avibacterium sp. 20-129]URL06582.1 anhydro-N-acetylmuramic acid kinase [Avibacterium sp. 21-595]